MTNQLKRKEFKNAFRVFCSSVPGFLFRRSGFSVSPFRRSGFSVPAFKRSVFSVPAFHVPGFLFQRSTFRVFCSSVPRSGF